MTEHTLKIEAEIEQHRWSTYRFKGIKRNYKPEEVVRLRGALPVKYTIALEMANKLWGMLNEKSYVKALGALTGHQAVQMVKAGLKAIYCSGWQVAADMNSANETYPDQSLYPANSVPILASRLNKALKRASEIQRARGSEEIDWWAPIVSDAEAGFGGHLNSFEIMKMMIVAGAAGVHFEDQLSSEKKCGHLGGKVVIPTSEFINRLNAARLAADVLEVPTILIARTDAFSGKFLSKDIDERDRAFMTGQRTSEGFYEVRAGIEAAIARGLAYAPYADMLWWETSTPDMTLAKQFAEAIHQEFPEKLLAYNCSPSFNWSEHLSPEQIAKFQDELGALGYKFQFVTLAGFHALNYYMFKLAKNYVKDGMTAYVAMQNEEFAARADGYDAVAHQQFVGTDYFDRINEIITGGQASTLAMKESTEAEQFKSKADPPLVDKK